MKKLVVAAAMVCVAASVHAATVVWGGAAAAYPDYTQNLAVGTQCALLYSSTAFTADATSIGSFEVGATADNGGSIVSTYSLTSTDVDSANFGATWDNTGKSVDGYYAILILNDAGTFASYKDMGSVSGTTATSAQTYLTYNDGWVDSDTNNLTMGGYTVAVPEPTSGLLILLGMAGLALRRKHA